MDAVGHATKTCALRTFKSPGCVRWPRPRGGGWWLEAAGVVVVGIERVVEVVIEDEDEDEVRV